MTPLIFSKGLADAGCWGTKFYGRVTTEEAQVGLGCEHKTRRLKVIYGLDPVFESGSSCFMKVRSPIAYESREETVLAERNLQITKQVTCLNFFKYPGKYTTFLKYKMPYFITHNF